MTNASKYGILMHSVDNFIQVTVVRDTKEAAMSLLQSVLLGLIQGLTEFLPVSSSGHLAIFKQFFQIETGGMFFDILLHIGTLIAVFIVYYKDIFRMIKEGFAIIGDSFVNVATFFKRVITKEDLPYRKIVHNSYRKFVMLVIVSTIPTGIIGIAAKDLVSAAEQILLVPGICLIITAVLLFIADRIPDGGKTPKQVTYPNAYLRDFVPVLGQILKEKQIAPEKLHLEIIDEESEEKSIFEPVGVDEVLDQLADQLNHLTVYTDRPAHFQAFAEQIYEENGLMPLIFTKKQLKSRSFSGAQGVADRADMRPGVGDTLVLDFEWEGQCYFNLLAQGKNYIPIHKKPWKIAENLDIIVPFGYNTVIVKSRQNKKKKPVRDRFEEAFYSD